jgi:prepilin-type N-terminal cleavage/methylation domain-containing protein
MRRATRRAGMTLVEVLLAVAILATALTALLTAASRCMATLRRASFYQKAHWALGMGELAHPPVVSNDVRELEVEGEDYEGFRFSRRVEEDEDEDDLYVVRTRVTWSLEAREGYEEVVRYVFFKDPDRGR